MRGNGVWPLEGKEEGCARKGQWRWMRGRERRGEAGVPVNLQTCFWKGEKGGCACLPPPPILLSSECYLRPANRPIYSPPPFLSQRGGSSSLRLRNEMDAHSLVRQSPVRNEGLHSASNAPSASPAVGSSCSDQEAEEPTCNAPRPGVRAAPSWCTLSPPTVEVAPVDCSRNVRR